MFRRLLLVFACIFHSVCYAQNTQETTTMANNTTSQTSLGESMILTTAMVVSMSSVLIILIPTALYYKYCAPSTSTDTWPTEIH
ncbi:hypothetical protein KPH14_010301 [Odynerus spinipes]|uniref:Membrane protein UL124 n=1 Tax=Odynerus spinipes TaxID=1348599 RepID=A0AAD9RTQ9_9HYME|nr:hypothetical protein KPH14_010301 [Odynerus spinipes]